MSETTTGPVWGAPATSRAPLPGDRDADVVIAGAGFSGLWTAYYLLDADPSLRVVVLEAQCAGFGASGRNGGWCSALFPLSEEKVAERFSLEAAVQLQRELNETVREVGRVVDREGLDCDFAHEGYLALARSTAQLAQARAGLETSARLGMRDQWRALSRAEARGIVGARGVLGGVFTEHCAVLHPGKLVRGLAELAERRGAVIHESTPVQRLGDGFVDTPNGRVRAPVVVRATEGYTPRLPRHGRTLAPLYSLALATEPLGRELRERAGLHRRVAFNDLRHLGVYAQLTAEDRLVFGGRGAPYHFRSRIRDSFDTSSRVHGRIFRALRQFFPALADVPVTHRWGGPLGVPRDRHPSVGFDPGSGHAWAGPYLGDGVAASNLAGRVLRNLVLGRAEPVNDLPIVDHRSPAWEREPWRWLGLNSRLLSARVADVEERVTGRPSRVSDAVERITGAH